MEEPQLASGTSQEVGENDMLSKVQILMEKITSSHENPNPNVLHAISSILETQESKYMEEAGHSSLNNLRASHNIGRLGSLVKENDEFFELISSTFLSETRYSISVQAAAVRLLFSCSLTWIYPYVFDDNVLDKIKNWVIDETVFFSKKCNSKYDSEGQKSSNPELLRTYSTGLFAVCLATGGPIVEDALTSGMSTQLMRYLHSVVLGDTSTSQKNINYKGGNKSTLGASSKGKEEGRTKARQNLEPAFIEDSKIIADESTADHNFKMDHNRSFQRYAQGEDSHDLDTDLFDKNIKLGDRYEYLRDESWGGVSRDCGGSKVKVNEGVVEYEQASNFSGSEIRLNHGRISKDRNLLKILDLRKKLDSKKYSGKIDAESFAVERGDSDEVFQEFKVGSKDISNLIKDAVKSAEAEARATGAPLEAVRAAGEAAAELVKSAALEEFQSTDNEDAAVLAASRATSTVIDAAESVEVSRISNRTISNSVNSKSIEPESSEEVEDFFLPDSDFLADLREKYCIQCLEILGEYVEILGPVLHEKGVDVCLELLQRSCKSNAPSKFVMFLPDVLKLISALAAHRKFAAIFVDRGGIQKLLSAPRVPQTFFGLSSCLFTIGSLQGIMERVCALPSDAVHRVVELALQLLVCAQDQARKNAALFFAAAFVFRAVIDSFDAQDGLLKVLDLLLDAASVRSGLTSGAVGLSTSGSLRSRSPAEVLTSSEKQIAYHTCVALRQYFRAHLLLLVDSIRPNKNSRSACRNIPSIRAAYKPLDISDEVTDAVFLQLQKDRKLGPAFVRARWPAVDKFLASNGHNIMLELCQVSPVERNLRDLLQYALSILHIITLVPHSRKLIVNCAISTDRVGVAVILDAINCTGSVEPDIIQPALNVLVNLVCPPPSISNKPPPIAPSQQAVSVQTSNVHTVDIKDRNAEREYNGEASLTDRSNITTPNAVSGLVGDRRISLGTAAGSAGIATQLEQGYRQAREAVRSNNGIKVLLHLLQPRIVSPPDSLDCLRALACRVLLGLARDDTIAHILTKLQVGKRLSELIRDSGNQASGAEQGRWQAELTQVAIELIAIVTNSGRASTLVASDAAIPTLRRIERAAIAAATPITYPSRELLLLMHEHLWASGLTKTAAALLKEAQLTPLPSLTSLSFIEHQPPAHENPPLQFQWPSGRTPRGFLSNKLKLTVCDENPSLSKCDSAMPSRNKIPVFSPSLNLLSKTVSQSNEVSSSHKCITSACLSEDQPVSPLSRPNLEMDSQCKTPIVIPMKRKLTDSKEGSFGAPLKRISTGDHVFRTPCCPVPSTGCRPSVAADTVVFSTSKDQFGRVLSGLDDNQYGLMPSFRLGLQNDMHPTNTERLTLDSLVVQYLKHQHRQCTAPITTLPPLSLLHPHVCPEPKRSLDAPSNATARLSRREFKGMYGGMHGNRRDRQLIYSRFRPWRTCRDDAVLLTCITFLENSSHIAAGSHTGDVKIFDSDSNITLESCTGHLSSVTHIQSCLVNQTQLILSSSSRDVKLWDASSISGGPMHSLEGCKTPRFSNSGKIFAALPSEPRREILLYDVETFQMNLKLSDTSSGLSGRGHQYSQVHFSPDDEKLLWNGVLWDPRCSRPLHQFDQFTDYGGGGFHPAGNEVIINSEVWDLRKLRLLRSVPSLDQTVIAFNPRGDVVYAILRRNLEDVTSAMNMRRVKHPLFNAFRTVDSVNYFDIATTSVDRCVLDFATEWTDSFVGLVTMDDQGDDMYSSARVYEIGRRRPTDDDSDPDDADSREEEDGDDDEMDDDVNSILGSGFDLDSSESNGDMSLSDFDEDDGDEGGVTNVGGLLEIIGESDDEDDDDYDSDMAESLSSGDDEDGFSGHGFAF